MDLIVIEIFLWAVLIFFFWVLKGGLSHVEADIEELGLFPMRPRTHISVSRPYDLPDKLMDAIGSYRDAPIYRYAIIGGQPYQFDHVCPPGGEKSGQEGQRCVAPGLIYLPLNGQAISA